MFFDRHCYRAACPSERKRLTIVALSLERHGEDHYCLDMITGYRPCRYPGRSKLQTARPWPVVNTPSDRNEHDNIVVLTTSSAGCNSF
jgi:hypothetical protein